MTKVSIEDLRVLHMSPMLLVYTSRLPSKDGLVDSNRIWMIARIEVVSGLNSALDIFVK